MSIYQSYPARGDEFDNIVFMPFVKKMIVDHSELATSPFAKSLAIEPGTYVLDVMTRITEAFTGSAPAITVGDSGDADGYLDATDVGTSLATFARSHGGDEAFAQGKYYASADRIIVDANEAPTAGILELLVVMLQVDAPWRESYVG